MLFSIENVDVCSLNLDQAKTILNAIYNIQIYDYDHRDINAIIKKSILNYPENFLLKTLIQNTEIIK